MAWKRSSSTFFVYIPTLNFGCWTAALPRSFFSSSSGLHFFLLILRLRKDADSLKPALYISFLHPALQVIYHIRRAALRRSLLTNITKFWRATATTRQPAENVLLIFGPFSSVNNNNYCFPYSIFFSFSDAGLVFFYPHHWLYFLIRK